MRKQIRKLTQQPKDSASFGRYSGKRRSMRKYYMEAPTVSDTYAALALGSTLGRQYVVSFSKNHGGAE